MTSLNGMHRAVRARVGRTQPLAAARASTPGMPASSTPMPQQASAASSSETQDNFRGKDLVLAQALVLRLAVNSEAAMIEQAQVAADEGFVADWGGSEAGDVDTEPERQARSARSHMSRVVVTEQGATCGRACQAASSCDAATCT